MSGVVSSADPVVLALDDNTEIEVTTEVLSQALDQGLVSKL